MLINLLLYLVLAHTDDFQYCKYKACDHRELISNKTMIQCTKDYMRKMTPDEMTKTFFFWVENGWDVFYICGPTDKTYKDPYPQKEKPTKP